MRQSGFVKLINFLAPLLAALLVAGCKKTEIAVAPSSVEEGLPNHAQPKLPTMKIVFCEERGTSFQPIGKLDAELALTKSEEQTGMMFRTNIQDSDSMLFVLPQAMHAPEGFWMMNCPESISAAYISADGVIREIHHLEKNDTTPVVATTDNIRFVLETSDGWFTRHHVSTGTVIRTEKGSLAETFLQK